MLFYNWVLAMCRDVAMLFTVVLALLVFSWAPLASGAVEPKVLVLYDSYISFGDG